MRLGNFASLLLPALKACSPDSPVVSNSPSTVLIAPATPTATAAAVGSHAVVIPIQTDSANIKLELRNPAAEIVTQAAGAATTADAQFPAITSWWQETTLANGVTTWVEVYYTQTFASVPDQLPSAVAGTIGLGNGTEETTSDKYSESGASSRNGIGIDGAWAAGVLGLGMMLGACLL